MNFSQQLTALRTIATKEFLRFIRIWIQTVLPPAISVALYFIIFGELIGSQIDDIDGFRYMDYIVPGLILMAVITNWPMPGRLKSSPFMSSMRRRLLPSSGASRRPLPPANNPIVGRCVRRLLRRLCLAGTNLV